MEFSTPVTSLSQQDKYKDLTLHPDDILRKLLMSDRSEIIRLIAKSYSGGRWLRGYIRGKLSTDPVFDAGLQSVKGYPGPVVDLGCGLGLFGLWLRANGNEESYRGCDLDEWKISAACTARDSLGYHDLNIECIGLESQLLNGAKTICLFDVFHYLPSDSQDSLISRLAEATRNGAQVLIRTGVADCGWRSVVTAIQEWWIRSSGWIRGGKVLLPTLAHLNRRFGELGCRVETIPLSGKTPFSSYFLKVSSRH